MLSAPDQIRIHQSLEHHHFLVQLRVDNLQALEIRTRFMVVVAQVMKSAVEHLIMTPALSTLTGEDLPKIMVPMM